MDKSTGILWRKRLYLAYVGLSILPYLLGAFKCILEKQNPIDIILSFLCAGFMASQFLMLKSIAKVFSGLFLFCFLIVELLPQWDLNPQITVGQIRLMGLVFLMPSIVTAICWKALR
ncbi:MAG: hypothetical protein ABFD69_13865 [Candidatus Sumerlaeia bacterium]